MHESYCIDCEKPHDECTCPQEESMRLRVTWIHGEIEGVWVENVPLGLTDTDVRTSVEALARDGDVAAIAALPYVRVALNGTRTSVRVYKD